MDANSGHPSKEEVRAWMARRQISSRAGLPPPAPDEIRRELHWHLPPAPAEHSPAATPPLMLAELAAGLAAWSAVTWCWFTLQLPRDRARRII